MGKKKKNGKKRGFAYSRHASFELKEKKNVGANRTAGGGGGGRP